MKNIRGFYPNLFQFLEVKCCIYLNRHVFVMNNTECRPMMALLRSYRAAHLKAAFPNQQNYLFPNKYH